MSIILIIILILFGWVGFSEPDCSAEPEQEGCARSVTVPPATVSAPWLPVNIGDIEGVVVSEADGRVFTGVEDYWTPTVAEITAAEDAIRADQGALDHTRQYLGFYEDGVRKIYVNGFCDDLGIDWQQEPVVVDDGGDCFFSAVYNVETSELEQFLFNGEG